MFRCAGGMKLCHEMSQKIALFLKSVREISASDHKPKSSVVFKTFIKGTLDQV